MQSYLDFCGNHEPDFSLMDKEKADKFLNGIAEYASFSELVLPFEDNLDQLAYCAVYAFSQGKLSRLATANFLEYRSLKKDFLDVKIIEKVDISRERFSHYLEQQVGWGEKICVFLDQMPHYERCFFSANIPDEHLLNPKIGRFIDLAHRETIIEVNYNLDSFDKSSTITIPSTSIRDAITKTLYGQHAKKSCPRLGLFSIDMMGEVIENHGRYIACDYPGIPTSPTFHKIESPPTYITLHDELHRKLMSTIPNPAYVAFIDAINMVREKTGFKWSREIWDAMDMEVGEFLNAGIDYHSDWDVFASSTERFTKLLNATVYTESRMAGLFTASPYIDTTWLLLIDIALNDEKWKQKRINFSDLTRDNPYYFMYEFVLKNKDKIVNLLPAEQVAVIKSTWFDISLNQIADAKFVKDDQPKQPRYIQIKINDKPIGRDKHSAIQTHRAIHSNGSIKFIVAISDWVDFIIHDPYLFNRKFIDIYDDLWALDSYECFSFCRDRILKAMLKYKIRSVNDLLSEVSSHPNYVNEFISLAIKEEAGFSCLEWNLSDLYSLFLHYPDSKQAIIQSIVLHDPLKKDLFERENSPRFFTTKKMEKCIEMGHDTLNLDEGEEEATRYKKSS